MLGIELSRPVVASGLVGGTTLVPGGCGSGLAHRQVLHGVVRPGPSFPPAGVGGRLEKRRALANAVSVEPGMWKSPTLPTVPPVAASSRCRSSATRYTDIKGVEKRDESSTTRARRSSWLRDANRGSRPRRSSRRSGRCLGQDRDRGVVDALCATDIRIEISGVQSGPDILPEQSRHSSGKIGKSVCIPERQAVTEQLADPFRDRRVEDADGGDSGIELRLHDSVKAPVTVGLAFRLGSLTSLVRGRDWSRALTAGLRDACTARGPNGRGVRVGTVVMMKAGGTGLNLTATSHVVHFDRWWNPAVENQATDRAFRIGQRRNVLVHRFMTTSTVEERINDHTSPTTPPHRYSPINADRPVTFPILPSVGARSGTGRPSSHPMRPASRVTDASRIVPATMESRVMGEGQVP